MRVFEVTDQLWASDDIAERIEKPPGTVRHNLERLEQLGLAQRVKKGRGFLWRLHPKWNASGKGKGREL